MEKMSEAEKNAVKNVKGIGQSVSRIDETAIHRFIENIGLS